MIRLLTFVVVLLCCSPVFAEPSAAVEKSRSKSKFLPGVRLLLTSSELTTNPTGAKEGSGFGVGIDLLTSRLGNISLEIDKIEYEGSQRIDKRVHLRERLNLLKYGGLGAYAMLSIGLTSTTLAAPHQKGGLRLDAETGLGAAWRVTDRISLFGELGIGFGEYQDKVGSALSDSESATTEGFTETRIGVQIDF